MRVHENICAPLYKSINYVGVHFLSNLCFFRKQLCLRSLYTVFDIFINYFHLRNTFNKILTFIFIFFFSETY